MKDTGTVFVLVSYTSDAHCIKVGFPNITQEREYEGVEDMTTTVYNHLVIFLRIIKYKQMIHGLWYNHEMTIS